MNRIVIWGVSILMAAHVASVQNLQAESQSASIHSRPLKIAWFSTMTADEKVGRLKLTHTDFWPTTKIFMEAVADDLGVDLQIYYANANFVLLIQQVEKTLANPETRPDAMVFHNWKGSGEKILQIGETYGVKSFVFNAGFPSDQPVGKPRQKYHHWVGQMYPDDEHAGYELAARLIKAGMKLSVNKGRNAVEMVGLEGNRLSKASNLRTRGLQRALSEFPNVTLHQLFHTKWSKKLGGDAFSTAIQRYPGTTVFWTASESMAIGVIEKAAELGKVPGRDLVTGGVDLLPKNFPYLQSGRMWCSIGGHYLEGAWVLILLHDYLNGKDFADQSGVNLASQMITVSQDNKDQFGDLGRLITPENVARIDFKQYSRIYNPNLTTYAFRTDDVLKQLSQ